MRTKYGIELVDGAYKFTMNGRRSKASYATEAEAREALADFKRRRANRARRERDQVMRDCGLVKVRGAKGGTYWE